MLTTSLLKVGSANFCSISSTSETVFSGNMAPAGSADTVGASRCRSNADILFPWTLCVSLISSRSLRMHGNMPSLRAELSTCSRRGV